MRSVIDILDLTVNEIEELINTAEDMIENPSAYTEKCKGKKLATLFFEPSTRTRLSFESAMLEMGGSVIGFSQASSTSTSKGETVADTSKVVSCYADIIAMRHPKEGAPFVASLNASIPVINAGDGGHCHPTQTLADLLTIHREQGRLGNLTVGFCGDLKYGRTVHSLISALSRYDNVTIILISPEELKLPGYIKYGVIEKCGMKYLETDDLDEVIGKLDILYMTRVQGERFADNDEYLRLRDKYILTAQKMQNAKSTMSVLHPLPRVNEISVDVDSDPRACYFKQVYNGKFMRRALILKLLSEAEKNPKKEETDLYNEDNLINVIKCPNGACISTAEQGIDSIFRPVDKQRGIYRCAYCEAKEKYFKE